MVKINSSLYIGPMLARTSTKPAPQDFVSSVNVAINQYRSPFLFFYYD